MQPLSYSGDSMGTMVSRFGGTPLRWASDVALGMIVLYRAVSPVFVSLWGPACRFEPTCSRYAMEAISRYGLAHGGLMALKRLLKCRPLGGWGFDPIPQTHSTNDFGIAGPDGEPR